MALAEDSSRSPRCGVQDQEMGLNIGGGTSGKTKVSLLSCRGSPLRSPWAISATVLPLVSASICVNLRPDFFIHVSVIALLSVALATGGSGREIFFFGIEAHKKAGHVPCLRNRLCAANCQRTMKSLRSSPVLLSEPFLLSRPNLAMTSSMCIT
jgi:hypothetical protein